MKEAVALALDSPAKINWNLRVLGRRRDGFHELQSLFLALDLNDRLVLHRATTGRPPLTLHGLGAAELPCDERNLVLRAEQAWRQAGGEAPAVSWELHKAIPAAAGLGGGSANAVAALRLLEAIATQAARRPLAEMAAELGSDLPFFLGDSPRWRGGRGEVDLGPGPATAPWVVVVVPALAVSTAAVFGALDAGPVEPAPLPPATATAWPDPGPNDLLPPLLATSPAFARWWEALQEVAPFQLSGSGGACFLPLTDPEAGPPLLSACRHLCEHGWVVRGHLGPVLASPRILETP